MKKHDIWLRLLSLVLAFVLWAVVIDEENPDRSLLFSDIPITVTGRGELLANYGLSLIEMDADTVSVTVSGPLDRVTEKSLKNRISVTVDLSSISEASEYDLPVNVSVQRSGVEMTAVTPRTIHVRVDKITSTTVPVRVEAVGTPAEGCRIGKPEPVTAENVTVEGPASELEEVAYAYATISIDGVQATKTEECPITLYNDAGEPITGTHVTCKTERVKVRLPVYPIETIPLTVTLKDGGIVSAAQARVQIDPENINVIGDPNVISEMQEINIGEIDLGSVRTGVPVEMEIPLPDGVRLDEGQPRTATVTVTIDGVDTRTVEVTRFAPNDTADEPGAYTVTVATQSVEVELRGSESALAEVDETGFTVGLTFDSSALGAGIHTVRGVVVASGLPAGVTLVEEDVQIMIEIAPAPQDGADGEGGGGA